MKYESYLQKRVDNFKNALIELKLGKLTADKLPYYLGKTHRAFLMLKAAIRVLDDGRRAAPTSDSPKVGSNDDGVESIHYITNSGIIIGLKNHKELEGLFVGMKEEECEQTRRLYDDYGERCCDFCGKYFYKPYYDTPIGRKQEEDFVLAYHLRCYECRH